MSERPQSIPGEYSHQTPLAARSLHGGYPGRANVIPGFDANFEAGEVCALVGPNGAGKSTLLRMLLGSHPLSSGAVLLQGRDVRTYSTAERARRCAFIAQRPGVAFAFTAGEVVALGCEAQSRRATRGICAHALRRVGLEDRIDEPLGALSVGQQQRVSVARALAQIDQDADASLAGRVLLADEPVASMDVAHAMETLDTLAGLAKRGACVVLVMHDLASVWRWCDRCVLLGADGRTVADDAPSRALRPEVLESVYRVPFVHAVEGTPPVPARLARERA